MEVAIPVGRPVKMHVKEDEKEDGGG